MKKYLGLVFAITLVLCSVQFGHAGRTGCPGVVECGTLEPGETLRHDISFDEDEPARVEAWSCHGEDIDISVYGRNFVVEDTLTDGHPVCRWTPSDTGIFHIYVKNCTNIRLTYRLETN